MIGVARPTRGLEFAESAQSLECELRGVAHVVERSWDKPIPDSFNHVTALLLAEPAVDAVLYLEEDTVMPPGGLGAMLNAGADIAHIPYWLKKGTRNPSYRADCDGRLRWVALGCTLVRRRVFEGVAQPWFKIGWTTASVHEGSSCKEKTVKLVKAPWGYGGQDVFFSHVAREAGFSIKVVDGLMCGHLVLDALGRPNANDGCHVIHRVS